MNEDVFTPKKPIVTYALIIINVIVFLLSLFNESIIQMFAVNRFFIADLGQYYRLFTGIFLHANFLHLIFNMYALYVIGMQLESFLGKGKYLAVYLLSGLGGSMLSIFFSNGYSVGASGAIFGLMGALLYFGYHYRVYLGTVVKSQIIPLIIINLGIGFAMSGVNNAAHIGGLIGGCLLAMTVGVKYKSTKYDQINGAVMTLIYAVFLIYMGFFRWN